MQRLLENGEPTAGPCTFRGFRTRIKEEIAALPSRPVLVAPIITAAQQLGRDADQFEALRVRAGKWRDQHREIQARFHDDREKTTAAIGALRAAAESADSAPNAVRMPTVRMLFMESPLSWPCVCGCRNTHARG